MGQVEHAKSCNLRATGSRARKDGTAKTYVTGGAGDCRRHTKLSTYSRIMKGIMELSFPRTFAPGSESSIGRTFAPWNFRSRERK